MNSFCRNALFNMGLVTLYSFSREVPFYATTPNWSGGYSVELIEFCGSDSIADSVYAAIRRGGTLPQGQPAILKPVCRLERSPVSLQIEQSGAVLTLRLDRPDRLNAINESTAQQLLSALHQADLSSDVRVIVLRGSGRAFCAGRDISEAPTPEILDLVQRVSAAMVRCSKPIVCAVHGWVVGAGVEWMLDTDIVIATRSARFKLPEAEIGVFVTGGIVATLPAMTGLARAKGILLLGEEFSAMEAERWGLIWKAVDDDALDAEAARVARRLAALSPDIVHRFKRVLNEVGLNAFDKAIALETQMQTELQSGAAAHKAP